MVGANLADAGSVIAVILIVLGDLGRADAVGRYT
jgi:hypothetical protein